MSKSEDWIMCGFIISLIPASMKEEYKLSSEFLYLKSSYEAGAFALSQLLCEASTDNI